MSLDELARPFVVEQVGKPEGWFALDSTLEGDEFEPSVPGRERVSPFGYETGHRGARGSLVTVAHLTGDRGFESISLQERVHCELDHDVELAVDVEIRARRSRAAIRSASGRAAA